jgi:hypothetical protein
MANGVKSRIKSVVKKTTIRCYILPICVGRPSASKRDFKSLSAVKKTFTSEDSDKEVAS